MPYRLVAEEVEGTEGQRKRPGGSQALTEERDIRLIITLPHEGDGAPADPVRLADLLDELERLLLHCVEFQAPGHAMLVTCWIANTYTFDLFRCCGYLALRSTQPRCGKSRLLQLISLCSKGRPKVEAVPTPATLIRSGGKVILIDEADRLTNRDKETQGVLVAVLNVGFEEGAIVTRSVKARGTGEWVPKEYPVYGPKAMAGVEKLTDTLSDRTFIITLKRAATRMPRLNERRLGDRPANIREALQAWFEKNREKISSKYDALLDELPELRGLDDRFQDISEPLLVLAMLADEERPDGPSVMLRLLDGIRAAAKRRESGDRSLPPKALYEMIESLLGTSAHKFISSKELLEACRKYDDFAKVKSPKGLASRLKRFGLGPRESPDGKCRGYMITKEWVEDYRSSVG